MFASREKSTVQVADQDGFVSVVICKLSAFALEKAKEARQLAVLSFSAKMGAEMLKSFREAAAAPVSDKPAPELTLDEQREARYQLFDRTIVLNKGIVSWSAPEKVNETTIEDLDETAAQQLHEAILDKSLPALDAKAEELKTKNG